MTIPRKVRTKLYALRVLALVLMLFAVASFMLGPHDFALRALALLAMFLGLWIVRRSDVSLRRARGEVIPNASFEGSFAKQVYRVGPLAWTLTGLSLAACLACYFLMYRDQLQGGTEVWPVYAFFVVAVALTLTAGYAIATISNKWFR